MSAAVAAPAAIKEILFATDFSGPSRATLPLISSIARRFGSHLTVINVWSEPVAACMTTETAGPARVLCDEAAHTCMHELLTQPALAGIKSSALLCQGEPGREILEAIEALRPDLLVMATHGRTGLARAVLGSVAEAVFRRSRCPVLTIGPALVARFSGGLEFNNLLIPTDLSPDSRTAAPLAGELVNAGGKVHVLHVLPRETALNPDARTLCEPLRQQMKRIFDGRLTANSSRVEFLLESGPLAATIVGAARRLDVDLIVMGLRPGYGVGTNFRTTTAYGVVLYAPCPVLTVRSAESE